MPELPDVEGYRRLAELHALGRSVAQVHVPDTGSLKGASPATLERRLGGETVQACHRRGKVLFLAFSQGVTLAMHFGTNGALRHVPNGQHPPSYTRVLLEFGDGDQLAYINPRRIGGVQVVADQAAFIREAELGPDVMDPAFTLEAFTAALGDSRQSIKTLLMDQSRMAGIGNIFSDEILFHARLHPAVAANALDRPAAHRLFDSVKSVLLAAIDAGAGAEDFTDRVPRGFLLPERHPGGRCPLCHTEIRSFKIGGRTAYYCPKCQPEPGH